MAAVKADTFGGEPLEDTGVKLATLHRGPNVELRIRWKEFKGHHYLDIREWSVNPHNAQRWPSKGKGISIKSRELRDVAEAIAAAGDTSKQGSQR